MTIKLDLFRIFQVVANEKSFSKAANKLFLTQPAISQFIATLEQELQASLFYRTKKGVILTPQGETLLLYVNQSLDLLEKGIHLVEEQQKLLDGKLTIGVGDTISRYFLIDYLMQYRERYPNVKLKVINGTTQEICQLILKKEIDLGICNTPIPHKDIQVIPYREVNDIFVCSPLLADQIGSNVTLNILAEQTLIMLDRNSTSRRIVEQYFQNQGIKIKPDFELGNHDLLLDFAKKGLGVASVVKEYSEDALLNGEVVELSLETSLPVRQLSVCTFKNVPLSQTSERFLQIIKKSF